MDALQTHKPLSKQYDFTIVPYNNPVAIAAGYTQALDSKLQVFSSVAVDREHFYYCTYSGNLFSTVFKNGLLVCLRKKDGSVVYVANVQDYNLDTGDTMIGPSRMVCRTKPVIVGDRLYLTSGWITNIGPQLFCVDKRTGTKIYSIAYDPPKEVRAVYGTDFITTVANYSGYKGYNAAVSDLNPVVRDGKIYLGTSSFQNFLNPGLIPTSNLYTGYPFWTDKGALTVVKEFWNTAVVEAQTRTAVRDIKPGEVLSLSDPVLNPFTPGESEVLIATVTTGPIVSPGAIDGTYYFAQRVSSASAPVIATDLAPFFGTVGSTITVMNSLGQSTPNLDLTGALTLINTTPGSYLLTLSTDNPSLITGTTGSGQFAVWYIKALHVGDTVENIYDANGLGYYGYSVWGSAPDVRCGRVTFGSGQAHSEPISERLIFSPPDRNYRDLKARLVDLTNQYAANPDPATLFLLNREKLAFEARIRQLDLLVLRSPRGQRSYVDAILSSDAKTGALLYGVRSVPNDVYHFLGNRDPISRIPILKQDIDGDLSSSVFSADDVRWSAATKNGALITIDLTHWKKNGCYRWNPDQSPSCQGINLEPLVYTGSNSALGGTNYVSTYRVDSCGDLHLLSLSSNISGPTTGGSTGTNGMTFEKFVSVDGKLIPTGFSYAYSYDQDERRVEWNTKLGGTAFGNVTYFDGLLLCNDNAGHLFVLNAKSGEIIQTIDSGADLHPMHGGIASPVVDPHTGQVFWIASYDAPGMAPTAGMWGWVLKLNKRR